MSNYRDYGQTIIRNQYGETVGEGVGLTDVLVSDKKLGQVYLATHQGNDRTDYMWRSFISFTYGGKHIEDFNLIATTSGNSLNRAAYAQFNDTVTSYDNLNGQQYWNSHYKSNSMDFVLVTDGMDQRMVDDFKFWFHTGEARELILAEHPNRAIIARVAEPPQLNLLPFESQVEVKISSYSYNTRTTLYKGTINLKLVMDEPFWYAKDNILGIRDDALNRYTDEWFDANGNRVSIFASKDALKILYEDGIPLGSMIQNNMLLGNGSFANVEDNVISRIWSMSEEEEDWDTLGVGARIEANDATYPYEKGVIAGAIINTSGQGITSLVKHSDSDSPYDLNMGHFYYCGTAPAPTIITFTLTPVIGSNGYITSPCNAKTTPKYNTITIESTTKQELCFTTPNLLTSFNKAIEIFETYVNSSYTWEDVREHLRDEVRHARAREWAVNEVNKISTNTISNSYISTLKTGMANLIKNSGGTIQPITFTFNSETGEATGLFKYRLVDSPSNVISTPVEEDVGDMLRSNYIIIRDRNYPTSNGSIVKWTIDNKEYSHIVYHDVDTPLTNLSILYKNMYL